MQAQGVWASAVVRELAGMLGWASLVSDFFHGHPDLHGCKKPRGRLGGLLLQAFLFQPRVLGPVSMPGRQLVPILTAILILIVL